MFVDVCGAGLICVTKVAPHWSRLRNFMIMRVNNDVTLRLTTGHRSEHTWMNCWCPTEWPHTVGPANTRYFRHTDQTSHRDISHKQGRPPTFILFYVQTSDAPLNYGACEVRVVLMFYNSTVPQNLG